MIISHILKNIRWQWRGAFPPRTKNKSKSFEWIFLCLLQNSALSSLFLYTKLGPPVHMRGERRNFLFLCVCIHHDMIESADWKK